MSTFKLNRSSNFVVFLFIFLLSLLLYSFSPDVYSNQYCILLFVIYIFSAFLIVKHTVINNNYFNFHVLFLISFFFVNFAYPVFLYPIDPFYFPVFKRSFNHDIITKATALALVGSSAYGLGVGLQFKKPNENKQQVNTNIKTLHFFSTILLYIFFLGLMIFGGMALIKGQFGSTSKIPAGLLTLFEVIIGLSVILVANSKTYKGNFIDFINKLSKPVLLILCFYILVFIFTGDRGPVIQIVLITIYVFSIYVKPVKFRSFILLALVGMFFLTFISYARKQTVKDTNKTAVTISKGIKYMQFESFFDIGMDLIVCNRNLYFGYDYTKTTGLSYGKNMFFFIFAPVPMLPSFLTHIFFNSTPDDLSTAKLITKKSKSTYGLGTNMIADLYMAFGVWGVIFFMLFLGYIVTVFHEKSVNSNNLNYIIAYSFLISLSIYLPRTTIFEPLRHIIWALLLFKFMKEIRILLINLSKNQY